MAFAIALDRAVINWFLDNNRWAVEQSFATSTEEKREIFPNVKSIRRRELCRTQNVDVLFLVAPKVNTTRTSTRSEEDKSNMNNTTLVNNSTQTSIVVPRVIWRQPTTVEKKKQHECAFENRKLLSTASKRQEWKCVRTRARVIMKRPIYNRWFVGRLGLFLAQIKS